MSRWCGCPCGAEQSDVAFPARGRSHLVSDEDLDAVTDYGARKRPLWPHDGEGDDSSDATIVLRDLERRAKAVWECWGCGRLLVYAGDGSALLAVYKKEAQMTDEKKADDLRGFTDDMSPITVRKIEIALKMRQGFSGKFMCRHQFIERAVADGAIVEHHKTGRRFILPTDSFYTEHDITKTGMDYAEYLMSNRKK